jgi:hypothetical protein
MIGLFCFALAVLASPFKSKLRLQAENAVLRHQLIILRRSLHGRVRFTNHDRWFLIQLYRWFPSIPQDPTAQADPSALSEWPPILGALRAAGKREEVQETANEAFDVLGSEQSEGHEPRL